MRNVIIIAYDVTEDRRRNKIHSLLKGYGYSLQYSIFRCELTTTERLKLRQELWDLLDLKEDRILLLDLGPRTGRLEERMETWGKNLEEPLCAEKPLIV